VSIATAAEGCDNVPGVIEKKEKKREKSTIEHNNATARRTDRCSRNSVRSHHGAISGASKRENNSTRSRPEGSPHIDANPTAFRSIDLRVVSSAASSKGQPTSKPERIARQPRKKNDNTRRVRTVFA
jgi:hypothetical protein